MTKRLADTLIIRLDDVGALFQCKEEFVAILNDRNDDNDFLVVTIEEDDFLLFLGIRHFHSRKKGFTANIGSGPICWPKGAWRDSLHQELFRSLYYTSLNFLWKEKIVKVDWHGSWSLDQLAEASHFMYRHFLVPESVRRSVGE